MSPGPNLHINEKIWRKYKSICALEGIVASQEVQQFMEDRIAESKEKY